MWRQITLNHVQVFLEFQCLLQLDCCFAVLPHATHHLVARCALPHTLLPTFVSVAPTLTCSLSVGGMDVTSERGREELPFELFMLEAGLGEVRGQAGTQTRGSKDTDSGQQGYRLGAAGTQTCITPGPTSKNLYQAAY